MGETTQFGLALDGFVVAPDRPTLAEVLGGADAYRARFTYHRDCFDWADSLISEREADDARDVVLVVEAGRPVGMMELVLDGSVLTIALLVVVESARLRGVGMRAVDRIAAAALAARSITAAPFIDALAIGVEMQNRSARAFWERIGFVEVSAVGSGVARIANLERWLAANPDEQQAGL
ncbi:MAG: GNAT family N-acetyltransferase [Deltaproteobacteria bacterium]|nr:GNAT family N-acetyltransferase [Deltaproteobacteria bacterium]